MHNLDNVYEHWLQGAEDFRSAKRKQESKPNKTPASKRTRGVAFGTGIMDEDDVFGMTDDYVVEPDARQSYDFDLQSEEEDGSPARSETTCQQNPFKFRMKMNFALSQRSQRY